MVVKQKNVATVNSSGKVTAKRSGKTTIKAKYNGHVYKCIINVKKSKLSEKNITLRVGYGFPLEIINFGGKAIWKSSNSSVAKVNSRGYISPCSVGAATISAKVGSETYFCQVKVVNNFTESDFVFDEPDDDGYTNYIDYSTNKPTWYWYWDQAGDDSKENRGINVGDTYNQFISAYGYCEYQAVSSSDEYSKHFSNSAYPRTKVILEYKDELTQKRYYKSFYFDRNGTLVLIVWHR